MANRELFEEYRSADQTIRDAAMETIRRWFQSLDMDLTDAELEEAIHLYMPLLIEQHAVMAAVLAADAYDTQRLGEGVRDRFRAVASRPRVENLGPSLRWAAIPLTELADQPPEKVRETILNRLTDVADVRIQSTRNETKFGSMRRDPVTPKWARVPGPNACDFCRWLGGRGFQYPDWGAAGTAKHFNGTDYGYHAHCDCDVVASWDTENPSLDGYDWRALRKEYKGIGGSKQDIRDGFKRLREKRAAEKAEAANDA